MLHSGEGERDDWRPARTVLHRGQARRLECIQPPAGRPAGQTKRLQVAETEREFGFPSQPPGPEPQCQRRPGVRDPAADWRRTTIPKGWAGNGPIVLDRVLY